MTDPAPCELAAAVMRERAGGLVPRVGLILGSGLGGLAQAVDGAVRILYAELPGFPPAGVHGHAGELVLGRLEGGLNGKGQGVGGGVGGDCAVARHLGHGPAVAGHHGRAAGHGLEYRQAKAFVQ